MIAFMRKMLGRGDAALAEADPDDAAALSRLHVAAFRRGWAEDEFERLLVDRHVLVHRATLGRELVGFILSRMVAGEAEILSVAVAPARRVRGLAGRLLTLHLRRLAGLGVEAVFLEVDEGNAPARRLYGRTGFREVGRRPGYYPHAGDAPAAALVLRRDLA
jgi:[ribosomal protein S18]-alanine N-acetyltransferase